MITEDYVSFETAKLLKEKGFDEYCYGYYYTSKYMTHGDIKQRNSELFPDSYSAPTLQMAMKWLREVHNKHCHASLDYVLGWYTQIVDTQETVYVYDYEEMKTYPEQDYGFNSYEEACEAAIKYCLENLI